MDNLLTDLPPACRDEVYEDLLRGGEFRVERIISTGQTTPANEWFDQAANEWVVLMCGAARLRLENPERILEMRQGDYVNIPAHQRHRVEWTDPDGPTVWLAIHYQPHREVEGSTEGTS